MSEIPSAIPEWSESVEVPTEWTPEFRAIELAHSLSRIADIIRETPDHVGMWENYFGQLSWFAYDENTVQEFVKVMTPYARRTLAGERGLTKKWSEYYLRLIGFLGTVEISMVSARDTVCERIVTGTREVTRVVPDPSAPMVEVTESEEIVEWRCGSLLKDGES